MLNCKKEVASAPEEENPVPPSNGEVYDADGNKYATVVIGTQEWFSSNLKTTKYKDGTAIPLWTDNIIWGYITSPGYCWYNNDASTYKIPYGALYNWYSVKTGNLCPTGWRVPSNADWSTLTTYLGGEMVASGKLKETGTSHWSSPNTDATNTSGFTALPGGYRVSSVGNGTFGFMGSYGWWWSSTENSNSYASNQNMNYYNSVLLSSFNIKQFGFSVRCIKN